MGRKPATLYVDNLNSLLNIDSEKENVKSPYEDFVYQKIVPALILPFVSQI